MRGIKNRFLEHFKFTQFLKSPEKRAKVEG
jgi:hypothetical protein